GGTGGTTDGNRRMPEPAKPAPTSKRAAAARSVVPRPRPKRLAGRVEPRGRRLALDCVPAIAASAIDPASNGPTLASASERRAAARRRSNRSKSVIAKFSSEAKQQAREASTSARRRHPERAPNLVGAQLGHVAKGDQGPVGWIKGREDPPQIRGCDTGVQEVRAGARNPFEFGVANRDLVDDRPTRSHSPAGPVCGAPPHPAAGGGRV